MWPDKEQITKDGYDMQFGTNTLGHFFLTKLLMPTLIGTATQSDVRVDVRVIHVGSSAASAVKKLNFDVIKDGPARRKMTTGDLYNNSKYVRAFIHPKTIVVNLGGQMQGNLVLNFECARRYGEDGVVSIYVDPGIINTDLQRHMGECTAKVVVS